MVESHTNIYGYELYYSGHATSLNNSSQTHSVMQLVFNHKHIRTHCMSEFVCAGICIACGPTINLNELLCASVRGTRTQGCLEPHCSVTWIKLRTIINWTEDEL